jgi:post-segregation antitoxin (ccd killing protein)
MEHANNNEKQVPISLDEGIIDKAKAADINVAAISEQLLKSNHV